NATKTEFNVSLDGNTLRVPSYFGIPKGQKWRAQKIHLTISVPDGKYIVFGEKINNHVHDVDYADDDGDYYISDYPNRLFRMSETGLTCADCPAFGERDYRGGRMFENFILEGDFTAEINDGDDFIFRIEGAPADRELVKTIRTGDKITFTTNGKSTGGRVKVYIETPTFTSLYADNTGQVTIRGFDEGRASISARGNSRIKGLLDVSENLELLLIGPAQAELTGKGGYMKATLTEGAVLESASYRANEADISVKDGSKARVYVNTVARVKKDTTSEVKIDGDGKIEPVTEGEEQQ
ncbi:MAG TPA: DUF2807 domain-containing protein, partial [Saprospiraceae bacterium]|nr:DUF2807 domain-containing protein [Saprospiraceae bacterium]